MINITLSGCNCHLCRKWAFHPHAETLTQADAETRRKAWEAMRVAWRGEHPVRGRGDV